MAFWAATMSHPPSGLHDVSLKIGELLAKVEGLQDSQESNTRQMSRFDGKLDSLGGDVRQLKNDMNELKPSVKRYDRDRNRILGGVAVISAILGAAGGLILDYIRKVFSV